MKGRGGGAPNADNRTDKLRECDTDKGGGGPKNPKILYISDSLMLSHEVYLTKYDLEDKLPHRGVVIPDLGFQAYVTDSIESW